MHPERGPGSCYCEGGEKVDFKNKFPMCFSRVSKKFSMCVPQNFHSNTTVLPHMLFSKVLLFIYAGRSKEEANPSPSSNIKFYIDEPQKFQNFVFW
jgi:hypothetical protein